MTSRREEALTRAHGTGQGLAGDLVLVVLSGKARGTRLRFGPSARIGKSSDNDLVLPDDTVSRQHCELSRSETGGILVRDLDSTNGTKVGRMRVREATVEAGATIRVGDVEVGIRAEPNQAAILPSESPRFGDAIGPSLTLRTLFGLLERIAPTDASVLLEGETGTGKDVFARAIHDASPRKADPFVVVDCGAVSYSLIESELFGHERGAFTGAVATRQGAFELARRGTIFLDEVGELPLDVQPKLLRVLESRELRRVGGNRTIKSEARIVAATKRNLTEEVARGKFREDLYFRLAVVPVTVPPLRQHREDIPALVEHFVRAAGERDARLAGMRVPSDVLAALSAHDWPGNVRELRNVLDRALYLSTAGGERVLRLVGLPLAAGSGATGLSFDATTTYRETRARFEQEFEREYVRWLLARHDGNVSAAARDAQMDRKHLAEMAKKHGMK